jgi:DNA-binding MarR family transcriptional regulator
MKTVAQIAEEVAMIGPRIGRKLMSDMAHVADLPQAQLFVVMRLFHQGGCRLFDICHEMKVSAPTATGIVTRLEKSGYVKRSVDKHDRRAVIVALTPQGHKVALKLRGVVVQRWTEILSRISRDDAEKYIEILKKISEAI